MSTENIVSSSRTSTACQCNERFIAPVPGHRLQLVVTAFASIRQPIAQRASAEPTIQKFRDHLVLGQPWRQSSGSFLT